MANPCPRDQWADSNSKGGQRCEAGDAGNCHEKRMPQNGKEGMQSLAPASLIIAGGLVTWSLFIEVVVNGHTGHLPDEVGDEGDDRNV